jgi:3-hydroxyacyl-CoA dehydrogenase/3-hydroxy-2-methylbutyryl-CoA dehydrogenase
VRPEGAVVVVTGGASGLGRGVAATLVGRGASVVLLDLPSSPGAEAAAELGDRAAFVPCDVTDPASVTAAWAAVTGRHLRVDVLVSCAGVLQGSRMVGRDGSPHPLDAFRRTVEVNLVGMFDVLRHAVASMAANEPGDDGERGLVVNVASIAAFEGQIGQAAYAASKGAVVSMTLPIARELGRFGIRVVTVAPGTMDTPMLGTLSDEAREAFAAGNAFPQRLGRPDDLGRFVLAAMENVYLNGTTVRLDAGLRMGPR